jgi:membrane associated rhomboid family serine protease
MAAEESRWELGSVLWSGAGPLLLLVGAMWAAHVVDVVVPGLDLDVHGIRPRTVGGLDGILWAPFLHGGFVHLLSNTVPLLVLGGLVLLRGRREWVAVTVFVVLVGGGLTWLLARSTIHIGSSILAFGYAGFLLAIGVVERSIGGILLGAVVVVLFGGTLLWGILPINVGVSWEGHLLGLTAGVLAAFAAGSAAGRRAAGEG